MIISIIDNKLFKIGSVIYERTTLINELNLNDLLINDFMELK